MVPRVDRGIIREIFLLLLRFCGGKAQYKSPQSQPCFTLISVLLYVVQSSLLGRTMQWFLFLSWLWLPLAVALADEGSACPDDGWTQLEELGCIQKLVRLSRSQAAGSKTCSCS